jgi:hypothetical protein
VRQVTSTLTDQQVSRGDRIDDEGGRTRERGGTGNQVDSKSGELECTNTEDLYMQTDLKRGNDDIGVTEVT